MRRKTPTFDLSLEPLVADEQPAWVPAPTKASTPGDRVLSWLALVTALTAFGLTLAQPAHIDRVTNPSDEALSEPAICPHGQFVAGWSHDAQLICGPPPAAVSTAPQGTAASSTRNHPTCVLFSDLADPGPCVAHLRPGG